MHNITNDNITQISRNGEFFLGSYKKEASILTNVMHITSVTDFSSSCSNYARKCPILSVECSPQKLLILLEILPAEQLYPSLHVFQNYLFDPTSSCKSQARGSKTSHLTPLLPVDQFLMPTMIAEKF